jgi:hypothetical protein
MVHRTAEWAAPRSRSGALPAQPCHAFAGTNPLGTFFSTKEREEMAKQSTTTRKQAGSERPKKRKADSAPSRNGQDVSSFEQELAEYLQERIKPGLNRGAIPMLARSIAKEIARRQPSEEAQSADDVDDADSNSTEAEADEGQAQAEVDDVDIDDAEDDDTEAEADDDEAEAEADYDEEAEAEADEDEEAEADDDIEAEADDDDAEAETEDDYEDEAEADDDFDDEEDDETEAAADDDSDDEGDEEDAAESDGNGSTDFEADMRELQGELGDDWILRFSVQGDESWLTAEKDDGSQRVQASTASVLAEVVELLNDNG